ncbi:hypothetical protein SeMB42_g03466 [Synchytrium endobioticum]|uniref:H/ACA ribonucleoprotein complex non-core subunit NAF1 n=1 Tax=Synchytrium endobioticum TaxID=286115 RepID=A0A507D6S4_9FUNG|nr:hypothetical protein SeMB42_g03466 [Synchytrium endobioticum]TPX47733.1 hypothetical protein SeLEV6574_g02494 [Synchytrium endobioticum]
MTLPYASPQTNLADHASDTANPPALPKKGGDQPIDTQEPETSLTTIHGEALHEGERARPDIGLQHGLPAVDDVAVAAMALGLDTVPTSPPPTTNASDTSQAPQTWKIDTTPVMANLYADMLESSPSDTEVTGGGRDEALEEGEVNEAQKATRNAADTAAVVDEKKEEHDDEDDDESDSSSEDDATLVLPTRKMTLNDRERALIAAHEMGAHDDEGSGVAGHNTHTKHELTALPPVEPIGVEIPATLPMSEIGAVFAVVETFVVVQAAVSGDYQVLDSDSILLFEDRTPLGRVYETLGPVSRPLYSVRFNGVADIDKEKCAIGARIFYMADLAKFVFTQPLKAQKGSDASNLHDEEPADDEVEFSDDEKELEYKRHLKTSKRKNAQNRVAQNGGHNDDGVYSSNEEDAGNEDAENLLQQFARRGLGRGAHGGAKRVSTPRGGRGFDSNRSRGGMRNSNSNGSREGGHRAQHQYNGYNNQSPRYHGSNSNSNQYDPYDSYPSTHPSHYDHPSVYAHDSDTMKMMPPIRAMPTPPLPLPGAHFNPSFFGTQYDTPPPQAFYNPAHIINHLNSPTPRPQNHASMLLQQYNMLTGGLPSLQQPYQNQQEPRYLAPPPPANYHHNLPPPSPANCHPPSLSLPPPSPTNCHPSLSSPPPALTQQALANLLQSIMQPSK